VPAEPRALPFKKTKFSLVYDKNGVKVPSLRFHNPTGFYYVRKTFKRYRIPELFEPLKETTIGKAKAAAEEKIRDHLDYWLGEKRSHSDHRFRATTINKVIDEILETYTPSQREKTRLQHKLYFGELKAEWGKLDISRFTLMAWTDWLKGFRERKGRQTYNDYRKHMNIVLNYANQHGHANIGFRLPNPDGKRKARWRVFTDTEIYALHVHMAIDTRDQYVLSYECYMRRLEVLHLSWDRVNLETGEITLRAEDVKTGSQTGKGRSFIASPNARESLRKRKARQLEEKVDTPWVFPSPHNEKRAVDQNYTAWRTTKLRAGIKGSARWHDLRHTALSNALLIHKVDITLLSEYAGVSVITLQRVYLHSKAEQTRGAGQVLKVKDDEV
jgi:hypothetical protein